LTRINQKTEGKGKECQQISSVNDRRTAYLSPSRTKQALLLSMTKENADSHNANRSYHFDFVNVATFAWFEPRTPKLTRINQKTEGKGKECQQISSVNDRRTA
jgi:hypothetical protein